MDPIHFRLLLLFFFIINCHQFAADKFIKIYAQNGTIRPILDKLAEEQRERAFAESLFFGQPIDFSLATLERAKRDTSSNANAKTTGGGGGNTTTPTTGATTTTATMEPTMQKSSSGSVREKDYARKDVAGKIVIKLGHIGAQVLNYA
jgi:hypothetical protein